jgi:hypothetical protein
LIVSIDSIDLINREGSVGLADDALTKELLTLVGIAVINRSLDVSATASVEDLGVLRENTGTLGNDTSNLDKAVHMYHSEVSQLILNWKLLDTSKDS